MLKTVLKLWPIWLLTATAFMVCNMLTPMMLDDCAYATSGRTLQAIVRTQHNAYLNSNGRVLAHGIAQLFSGIWGKTLFNIVNSIVAAMLSMLLFCFGRGHRSQCPWAVAALAASLVWFVLPDQPITLLLIAGSLNYVWASVVILLMLLALRWLNSHQHPWHHTAAVIVLCFVAGAWGEMYAVCMAPAMMVLALADHRYLNRQCIAAWIGFCMGALLMLLAPGNWHRMAMLDPTPFATRAINTIVGVADGALPWLWIATAILAIVGRRKRHETHFWRDNLLYIVATIVSVLFTTVSGAAWPRTFFACYVFAIVMLLRQMQQIRLPNAANIAIAAVLAITIVIDLAQEMPQLQSQRRAMLHCVQTPCNEAYAVWTGNDGSRKTVGRNALSFDAQNWRNTSLFGYHERPSLPVIPQQVEAVLKQNAIPSSAIIGEEGGAFLLLSDTITKPISSIVITFATDTVWLWPSKAARLIDIFGTNLHSHFTSHPSAWQRHLMKSQAGLEQTLRNTDDTDAFGQVNVRGQRVVFIDCSAIIHGISKIESIALLSDDY
ncbi:MAG: hypothetical protein IJ761_06045 [Bacteroidales bacterium]|nr:hypothetical protein [Bacteroidales bacterium]MBR1799443.1 hypothetical protein [Bacteroidales bacterium]